MLLLTIVTAIIDCVLLYAFFNGLLGKKNEDLSIIIYIGAFILMESATEASGLLQDYLNNSISSLLCILVSIIFVYLVSCTYDTSIKHRIFCTLSFQVIGMIAEVATFVILSNINPSPELTENIGLIRLIVQFIQFIIILAVLTLVGKIRKNNSISYSPLVFCLPITSTIMMFLLIPFVDYNADKDWINRVTVMCLCIIILNLTHYFILIKIQENATLKNLARSLELIINAEQEKYKQSTSFYRNTRKILHDTNKQLTYIGRCLDEGDIDGAKKHLTLTTNKVFSSESICNSGSLAIDALVSQAIIECRNKNIQISTDINIQADRINIEQYDLCLILGNMLDNAIVASTKLDKGDNPYIDVKIFTNNTFFAINVVNNTKASTPNIIDPDLYYKESANYLHGYGLKNISDVVTKYNGLVSFHQETNSFVASVAIYINQNSPSKGNI